VGFVLCGGAALLDLVGVDDAATDGPPGATADPEASDDPPWVPPVPVALGCVEVHAANAYPQIASSTGTAHRRYIAMSFHSPRGGANRASIDTNCNLPTAEAASEQDHVYNTYLPDLVRV